MTTTLTAELTAGLLRDVDALDVADTAAVLEAVRTLRLIAAQPTNSASGRRISHALEAAASRLEERAAAAAGSEPPDPYKPASGSVG